MADAKTKQPAAITVKDFHRESGVSVYRLNKMIDRGQLEFIRVNHRKLVLRRELARFGVAEE